MTNVGRDACRFGLGGVLITHRHRVCIGLYMFIMVERKGCGDFGSFLRCGA